MLRYRTFKADESRRYQGLRLNLQRAGATALTVRGGSHSVRAPDPAGTWTAALVSTVGISCILTPWEPLAQLVEQLTFNQ